MQNIRNGREHMDRPDMTGGRTVRVGAVERLLNGERHQIAVLQRAMRLERSGRRERVARAALLRAHRVHILFCTVRKARSQTEAMTDERTVVW